MGKNGLIPSCSWETGNFQIAETCAANRNQPFVPKTRNLSLLQIILYRIADKSERTENHIPSLLCSDLNFLHFCILAGCDYGSYLM